MLIVVAMLSSVLSLMLPMQAKSMEPQEEYTNPILAGFYPDPSICRVNDDYYLVNSTFAYYPGIPVFHSRDLVHWRLIGYCIDKPDELKYDSLGVSRGIFAPAIRYHNGLFYVTCTFVDGGGNFVVTSANPAGPWSKPVWLPQVSGIDPSLFFDDDGKAYIVYNSEAPENTPLYPGHRTIRMRGFDMAKATVRDDERILVNGGTNIAMKPVWIEGPHIFKVDGRYYLIAAEGGTAEDHSEVVFRSERVEGPYTPYAQNPILTQRDLSPERADPITCTGHADFVETQHGTWWAVFLGCQPYAHDFFNTGRETFLAPVTWKDGWPFIIPKGEVVPRTSPYPLPASRERGSQPYGGSFAYTDNFNETRLDLNWEFLRAPRTRWYSLQERPGFLTLKLRPETCNGKENPSFVGRRQAHARSSAQTVLDFMPRGEKEKAGLLVFQNETHFYYLCKSEVNGRQVVQLFKAAEPPANLALLASHDLSDTKADHPLHLRIESHDATYSFLWSLDGTTWETLKADVDATFLSTKTAGGFVGCMYALYATSAGTPSTNRASFDRFSYKGTAIETK